MKQIKEFFKRLFNIHECEFDYNKPKHSEKYPDAEPYFKCKNKRCNFATFKSLEKS